VSNGRYRCRRISGVKYFWHVDTNEPAWAANSSSLVVDNNPFKMETGDLTQEQEEEQVSVDVSGFVRLAHIGIS